MTTLRTTCPACGFPAAAACLAALLALVLPSAATHAGVELQQVGAWGGHCRAVELRGDRAVASFGGSVMTIDVSNPYAPTVVGQVGLDRIVSSLAVHDDMIYAGMEFGGLRIVDAAYADALRPVGSLAASGTTSDVAVAGNVAFLVSSSNTLTLVDVSNPAAPALMGNYPGLNVVGDVSTSGPFAYLRGSSFIHMLEVSEPGTLVLLHALAGPPGFAEPHGNHLFVAGGRLRVFRILDTPEPYLLYDGDLEELSVKRLAVDDGRAAVLTNHEEFAVLDVSDPQQPVVGALISGAIPPSNRTNVDVSGTLAAIAGDDRGLGLFDVSDVDQPTLVSSLMAQMGTYDVAVQGGFAYVGGAGSSGGLHVVDISDPARPRHVATIPVGAPMMEHAIRGDYLFAALDNAGVVVYDLSDPSLPVQVAAVESNGSALDIKIVGDLAYVADIFSMRILNIADPALPVQLGSDSTASQGMYGVGVAGDFAFVANGYGGLRVYDVSNPAAPVRVADLDSPGLANDVEVVDGVAFVADDGAGIMVADVSNPSSPELIRQIDTGGFVVRLRLTDRYLFVGNELGGIRVYDVSNPRDPVAVASKVTAGLGWGMDIAGDYLYAATFHGGLNIYRIDGALGACCRTTVCGDCPSGQCRMLPPYTCDAPALMAASWTACRGDVDGSGRVNPADRGHIGANFGTLDPAVVCRYDVNGDGLVNAADRDMVTSLIGQCQPLPDFQNGSGLNNGSPDPRFGVEPEFRGLGSMCPETPCESE